MEIHFLGKEIFMSKGQFRKGFQQRGKDGVLYFVQAIKLGTEKIILRVPVANKSANNK